MAEWGDLSFRATDRREVRWGIKEKIQSSLGGTTHADRFRKNYGLPVLVDVCRLSEA